MQTFHVVFLYDGYDGYCYGMIHEGGTGPGSGGSLPFSCKWRVSPAGTIMIEGTWNEPRHHDPFRYTFKKNGEGIEEVRGRIRLNRADKR